MSERPAVPCLEGIRAALWMSEKLRIRYRKPAGEISFRIVRPYGLVVKQGNWYLTAYCEEMEGIRTFRCERITKADRVGERFDIPADFCLARYWKEQNGSFKRTRQAREHYPVVLKLQAPTEALMNRLEILNIASERDTALLTVNMYGYEAACRDCLELIGYAEVIEPGELRAFVRNKLAELHNLYSEVQGDTDRLP